MQPISSKMCLCNLYVMSYYTYCPAIWLNRNESDNQKLERLDARAQRCLPQRGAPSWFTTSSLQSTYFISAKVWNSYWMNYAQRH